MKITTTTKKQFLAELTFVVKNMKETPSASEKLYYFSALYGMAQRLMNLDFDPELCFLFQILQLTYQLINARVLAQQSGQESSVRVPEGLFERLENYLQELGEIIEQEENTCPLLQKILNLAFTTTGNGYYLYLKGQLKV